MKKRLLILALTILSLGLRAQTVNTITGAGTATQEYPFGMQQGYTRSATVYSNPTGLITSLGWYVGSGNQVLCPIRIYIKTTSSSTIPSSTWTNMIDGATLVFDGMMSFVTQNVWQTIDVADFMNTGSKIIVMCESNYGPPGASTYPYFRYSVAAGTHEYWLGQVEAEVNESTGTINALPALTNNRPHIQITYTPASSLGSIVPPSGFMARAVSSSQINLNWSRNAVPDNVMVVYNTVNSFGTPSGSYVADDPFPGGGTVIYNGSGTNFSHSSGLGSSTTYYYKAWSVHGSSSYSMAGPLSSATTFCPDVTAFPYTTDIESAVFPPDCWSLAGIPCSPSTAAGGYGNSLTSVIFDFQNISSGNFDLISPRLDLSALNSRVLKFDYAYATTIPEQIDKLELWSSTDYGTTFTLEYTWLGGNNVSLNTGGATLSTFVPAANQWGTKSYPLASGVNRVMFRGISNYGNNLYLDNISFQEEAVLWNGSSSIYWNNAANWTPPAVPDGSKNISIPSGTSRSPTANSTGLQCKNLTIDPGATLTITSSGKLTVYGNFMIRETASLNNQGVVILKGNLDNQNPE